MVCRASWGERESSGGNDDENERTRLVEVRPTGPVSSCNGGWTALIDNRQEHQPLSRAVASRPLLYIEVSHLERRLLLQPLLERELQELRVRRALVQRDRRTCRSIRLVRRRRRHLSGRRRFLCGWRRRCRCRCVVRTQTARRRWRRRRRRRRRRTRRSRRRRRRRRNRYRTGIYPDKSLTVDGDRGDQV